MNSRGITHTATVPHRLFPDGQFYSTRTQTQTKRQNHRIEDVYTMRAIQLRLVLGASDRRAVGEVDGAAIAVRRCTLAGAPVELAFLVAAGDVRVFHARQSADCFGPLDRAEHHKPWLNT